MTPTANGSNACPVCGAPAHGRLAYPGPCPKLFRQLTISTCRACSFSWVNEPIPPDRLKHYYATTYGLWRDKFPPPEEYFTDESRMFKPHRSRAQLRMAASFGTGAPRVLLDIGAGPGTALHQAHQIFGRDIRLQAVEPDQRAREYLRRLGVEIYDRLEDVPTASCDLILASHVLEHIPHAELPATLREVHRALTGGGRFLIEVPHADFVRYPALRSQSHQPHLVFFSATSLRRLAEGHGFRVCAETTSGAPLARSGRTVAIRAVNKAARLLGLKRQLGCRDGRCLRLLLAPGD
jgi:SAM-dependent methyltransferase